MRLITVGKILGSLAMLAFAMAASKAYATLEVVEPFTYDDGNLVPNDPAIGGAWNAHSGTASQVQVSGDKISLVQGSGSREDVNVPLENGPIGTGDLLYSAFDLTVPDPGATVQDVYFAMFLNGTSNFLSRVWVTAPTTSGYRLALSNDNSITDADGEVFTGDLAFGATYRIVTSYDYDSGTGELWIDPTDGSSPSISATDPGFSDAVGAYAFRQATGNTSQMIDNLCVSDSFSEALTCTADVPEPASISLMFLAGLGLIGIRRRRS
jgi:PEP-CTERM motif